MAAIDQQVASLGFTCHCPVPFQNQWSMPTGQIQAYLDEIDEARRMFADRIEIYKSLEIDYIPNIIAPNDRLIQAAGLDYTLGSVHFVGSFHDGTPWEIDGPHQQFLAGLQTIYRGDIRHVISEYFRLTRQMVREACPDVIGHLDKIKMQNRGLWDENADWYHKAWYHTLEEIKNSGAIVEVNTRGIYKKLSPEPYPGRAILHEMKKMGIPVQINSDAHRPEEITGRFSEVCELLLSIGIEKVKVLHKSEWISADLDKNGLKM